jgi:hypothetical protein
MNYTHNVGTINSRILSQELIRITIRIVLGDDEWLINVRGGDTEDLQYVGMPQILPALNAIEQSLQVDDGYP